MADLKGRSVRGGAVTLAAQAVKFVLQIGSTMVLARLLSPQDFGLIAMVTAVTGFVAMFKDAGLSMATVQREHITHEQVSTLFWINVGLSVVVMLVVAALAPAIAWFYGEPALVWITLALAGTFIFGGLTVQHQALLRRQMRFRVLATVDILSMGAGIATAIAMAVLDFGYWSLVGLSVGTTIANCALVWVISDWRPGLPVRGSGVRPMLWFGGGLTGSSFLTYASQHMDSVVMGWAYGATPLGAYRKSFELMMLPVRHLNGPVASVMLPALSRLQQRPQEFRRAYLRTMQMLALAGMPIVALLFVEAELVVLTLLGPNWTEAVAYFRLLTPAAFVATIYSAPRYIFMTHGQGGRQLMASVLETALIIAALAAATSFGPKGIAVAISTASVLAFGMMTLYACRAAPVSSLDILRALGPIALAAVLAGGTLVAIVQMRGGVTSLTWLPVDGLIGAGVFIGSLSLATTGREVLHEGLRMISRLMTTDAG